MYRSCFMLSTFLLLIILLSGCGDVEPITKPPDPEVAEINSVLKDRFKRGLETEDLDLYMSSFWKEGYFYWSDMATDDNVGDDVVFEDWDQERESAINIFEEYRRNHYKVQFYVPEGTSLPGGYEAYYAEGDNIFRFDFKDSGNGKQEWRITEWRQHEFNEQEIMNAWELQ